MKKVVIVGLACVFGGSVLATSVAQKIKKVEKQIAREKVNNFNELREVNNFEDALVAAFANNQDWFANKTEKEIARIKLRQSKMNFLPSITASLSTSRSKAHGKKYDKFYNRPEVKNDPGEPLLAVDIDRSNGTYTVAHEVLSIDGNGNAQRAAINKKSDNPSITEGNNYQTGHSYEITLQQNIFNGWQTINNMSQCNNEDKAAYHALKAKGEKLIVDVLDAYSDVWKFRQALSARVKMESNLKKIFESQRTKLESGISTPAEVAAAETSYQTAVYKRIDSETELLSAESKFERITGVKLAKQVNLPDLRITIPKTLDQLIAISGRENHEILEARFAERAAMDALKVARGRLAPSINASLRYGRNLDYNKDHGEERIQNNYSGNRFVGQLQMDVPIFASSGNDYSQIGIAEQKAKQAQFKANDTALVVREQCVVNWNTYISTDAMIVASRSSVESAQLSSEAYQEESELGIKSNTEVWDQENKLQESKINLADSKKRRLVAAIRISQLMGQLELTELIRPSANIYNKQAKK